MQDDCTEDLLLRAAIFGHPSPTPSWPERLPYLLEVPSLTSSNGRFARFRKDTLTPCRLRSPDDKFFEAVERRLNEVAAYRATVAPAYRFWMAD